MIADGDTAQQEAALARARRNATGLLAVVAVLFGLTFLLPDTTATGYVRAALEAGMVGGLADWFAVVALFRHPLGIPIPHTAVIPKSKDGLGSNLAGFVEGNFVSEEQVRERIADPKHVHRLAAWLRKPENADRLVQRAAVIADATLASVDEEALAERASHVLRERLRQVPLAELAGQSLSAAIREQRHAAMVTAALEGTIETITRNRATLRQRLGEQSPSWVPPLIDDIVFERGEHVVRTLIGQLAADEDHELRLAFDEQLLQFTTRMETDEDVQQRVDDIVQDVLNEELLRSWMERWWADLRRLVATAAQEDAEGERVRASGVDAVIALGEQLDDDEALGARATRLLESLAGPVASIGQRELGHLIESTVERWDAEDTSRRLELWMGRDLQFVRINGTVVGGLVGVVLHGAAQLLGG